MNIDAGKYGVIIENGALTRIGSLCASAVTPCRTLLVSDSNVHNLYSAVVLSELIRSGFTPTEFIIPAGEESKTLANVSKILSAATDAGLTRSDIMIALGGGVIGDMTGFAASLYMRGIKYINIPTTLLAMVDASVGGKTGVDLPEGKNLAGAFYEPSLVISDPDVLATLPKRETANGMAEVIKTAMIGCKPLIPLIECENTDYPAIIAEAVKFKLDIVSRDYRDTGERQLLNFGHTIGHAIEKASEYTVSHGRAVAAGMFVMTKAAVLRGIAGIDVLDRLGELLVRHGLTPELSTMYGADELLDAITHDKKKRGAEYTAVMPTDFGQAGLYKLDENEICGILRSRTGEKILLHKPSPRPEISVPPSKSSAHRLLVLAAVADCVSTIECSEICDDIEKTVGCLRSLGVKAEYSGGSFSVRPINKSTLPSHAVLDCGESGTTFRFMLALAAALGVNAELKLTGKLPERPIKPLCDALEKHGAKIGGIGTDTVTVSGKLSEGEYVVTGGQSSQFTSALMLILPLLGNSSVKVTGKAVSKPYIEMTLDALDEFGYSLSRDESYRITGRHTPKSAHTVERDWSAASLPLVMGALTDGITVTGLNLDSKQGDRKIIEIIKQFCDKGSVCGTTVDCEDTPDLVPAAFILGMFADGDTVITGCARLRDKESDRIEALTELAEAVGIKAEYTNGIFRIHGKGKAQPEIKHCYINTHGDHRIAMTAAVVASLMKMSMIIDDAECVKKSFPDFWDRVFIGY